MSRRLLRILFGFAASFDSGALRAEPLPLELDWPALPECPTRDELEDRVNIILGAPAESDPKLAVRVVIERLKRGEVRAMLVTFLGGVRGERELLGASCDEVTDAAALVIALMLKPEAAEPVATKPAREIEHDAEPLPPPVIEPEPEPLVVEPARDPKPSPLDAFARFEVGAGLGMLPGVAADAGLGLGVALEPAALELGASLWTPKTSEAQDAQGVSGRFEMFELESALCLRPEFEPVRWDSCAGFALSFVQAEGQGATQTHSVSARIGSATLEQALALRLDSQLWLRASADVLIPLGRPRFSVRSLGEVYRPWRTAPRVAVALEAAF